ncbi:MAG: hypothetical protein F6K39_31240 [Okeania sp. SIO3B3]|nr:hypothetical protein [Okeania sp. SIO3B3]
MTGLGTTTLAKKAAIELHQDYTAVSEVMRYTHRGQDARTAIFSPFTLYVICPKSAVSLPKTLVEMPTIAN